MGLVFLFVTALLHAETAIPPITPAITGIFPHGLQRGTETEVVIRGRNLQNTTALQFRSSLIEGTVLESTPYKVRVRIKAAPGAELGRHDIRLIAPHGSILNWFDISDRQERFEKEPNDSRQQAEALTFPVLVNGIIKARDYDYFRFHADAGQMLTFDLLATRNGSTLDGVLGILDSDGEELEYSDDYYNFKDPHIVHRFEKAGDYFLRIYGTGESGGDTQDYRLIAGAMPHVDFALPSGAKQGETVDVTLHGVNLHSLQQVTIGAGIATAKVLNASQDVARIRITIPKDTPIGEYKLHADGATLTVPFVIGTLPELTVEGHSARNRKDPVPIPLGVTVNGVIDQPQAADHFTFTIDKPQRVLLEANSMRLGFLLDPLVLLYDAAGKRIAWQDEPTTNTGKEPADMDPHLAVNLEKPGRYTAIIRDAQFRGDPVFAYRLTVKKAEPDFELRVVGTSETLYRDRVNIINVRVRRVQGWNTPVEVCAVNLPVGVTAPCFIAEPKNTAYKGTCGETHYLDGTNLEIPVKVNGDASRDLFKLSFKGTGEMEGERRQHHSTTRYWKSRIRLIGDSEDPLLFTSIDDAPGAVLQVPEKTPVGRLTVIVTRIAGGDDPLTLEALDKSIEPQIVPAGTTRADIEIKQTGVLTIVAKRKGIAVGTSHPITVEKGKQQGKVATDEN